MAAIPSIGRATRVDRPSVPGAAAAGDLYERYSGQIFGYCLHQLGSREEAEDAVQTTFMNAFRGLQRGIVPELESAWLFKIAHNVCLSRRRSSWRRGKVEAPNNFEVLQEVVPGRERVADELIRLQDVLEDMPESQRRAILLREWQGLTYREISDELGLSQAAVETLIFRARRALAQGLEQDADTWKKRLRRGADVGGVVACLKTLLGGGGAAAIKIGATAAIVAGAAVAAATAPVIKKHPHAHRAARAVTTVAKTAATSQATRSFASARAAVHAPAQRFVRPASRPKARVSAPARLHAAPPRTAPAAPPPAASLPAPSDTPLRADPAAAPAQTETVAATPLPPEAPPQPEPSEQPPAAQPPAEQPPAPAPEGNDNTPEKAKLEHPDHPDSGHANPHK